MSTARTTPPPAAHKPPTAVADDHLAEEVRRLSGYTLQLLTAMQTANEIAEQANRQRARDVGKGVFFGSFMLALLFPIGYVVITVIL